MVNMQQFFESNRLFKIFHFSRKKLFSLLQAILGHVPIPSVALQLDANKMLEIAERMVNSLIEYFQTDQFAQNCYNSVLSATHFAKSLKTRSWHDCHFQQMLSETNLDEKDVNKLIRSGINSIDILLKTNSRDIEDVSSKTKQFQFNRLIVNFFIVL